MKMKPYQVLLVFAIVLMFLMLYLFPQRKSRDELIREGPPPASQDAEVIHVRIIPPHSTVSTATHEIRSSSLVR